MKRITEKELEEIVREDEPQDEDAPDPQDEDEEDWSAAEDWKMKEDRVRVLRLLQYEGPRSLVEEHLAKCLQGVRTFGTTEKGWVRLTAVTLDQFPEILEKAQEAPAPEAKEVQRDYKRRVYQQRKQIRQEV